MRPIDHGVTGSSGRRGARPSSFVWVTHPPAPPGCRVLHFELLATGPGSGHLSAQATGAGRDGLTLVGRQGNADRQARPWRVLGPDGPGTLNSRPIASESHRPRPIQVASDMCSEGGRAPVAPPALPFLPNVELHGLHKIKLHTLPLLAHAAGRQSRAARTKKTIVRPEWHAAAGTTLGLKPDTRRGYGVAARPRTLTPETPATRSGNARS